MPKEFISIELLNTINQIAKTAGEKILEVYSTAFEVEKKSDNSPLTMADKLAHETIIAELNKISPNYPILSEESTQIPYKERASWQRYWLVDPLDGTREFVKRNGEFTVNIAFIDNGKPILGVVYVPVTQVNYFAAAGIGAFKQLPEQSATAISVRPCPKGKLAIVGSRSHTNPAVQQFIDNLDQEVELISMGSSLKICLVAEGKADIYPRLGLTSEWDTAAAQCVVEQAGGYLTNLNLQSLVYNTKDSLLNPHFLVIGDKSKNWLQYIT
ncbi:MAG: 3'(2'),5'-bisphosphate nucleotidase CysQ [Thiomargarita sp.]|nr:3'(2'),5'-bisphosphate nucleotidase CysQ [Thiomargarita sp.]